MKFHVKVGYARSKRHELYEFDNRDLAFKFAAELFDDRNARSEDPVTAVLIAPAP